MHKSMLVPLLVLVIVPSLVLVACAPSEVCKEGYYWDWETKNCEEASSSGMPAVETSNISKQSENVTVMLLPNPMDTSQMHGYAVVEKNGVITEERLFGIAACGSNGIKETIPDDEGYRVMCIGAPEDVIWASVVLITWIDPIPGDEILSTIIVGGKFTKDAIGMTQLLQVALDASAIGVGLFSISNDLMIESDSDFEEFPNDMAWLSSWENHEEGLRSIQTLESVADNHRMINKRGDGRSNGSLEIWAKPPTGGDIGGFCVGHIVNNYVVFMTMRVPITFGQIGQSTMTYGDGFYFDPAKLSYDKAWIVSREIGNNTSEDTWLKIGRGAKTRFDSLRIKYGYVIPVMRVPLP